MLEKRRPHKNEQKHEEALHSHNRVPTTCTKDQYFAIVRNYTRAARKDLKEKQKKAHEDFARITYVEATVQDEGQRTDFKKAKKRAEAVISATLSGRNSGHSIVKEIIRDFPQKEGLRAFGFGVGYGQLLFFLKKGMGAKVKGVDLAHYSSDFTKANELGVIHGVNAANPTLRTQGKFDVTYSINMLEADTKNAILSREEAFGMLRNAAHMTKKGGKTYHFILTKKFLLSKSEIEAQGFKVDFFKEAGAGFLLKATKVKD